MFKFKYVMQHEDTGRICSKFFTLEEIEQGKAQQWINELYRYFLIAKAQFTGMNDKNGKEIYEGDYIKTPVGMWERYEIKFKSGCYVADYKGHFKFLYECKNAEIIGNIYDNPELLEVRNDNKTF